MKKYLGVFLLTASIVIGISTTTGVISNKTNNNYVSINSNTKPIIHKDIIDPVW